MSASMEKPKQSNWLDKIKLLAAAIGAAVALFFLQALLHDGIWLSTGWQYFAMGAVVYMTALEFCSTNAICGDDAEEIRKSSRWRPDGLDCHCTERSCCFIWEFCLFRRRLRHIG
jgi:hypothetical protein